jgi:hypothetical protein
MGFWPGYLRARCINKKGAKMTSNVDALTKALELDRDGDWDSAHTIVQGIESPDSYWIHAYLHRKEGAIGNSNYWYRRAKKTMPEYDLDQEWHELYEYITSK